MIYRIKFLKLYSYNELVIVNPYEIKELNYLGELKGLVNFEDLSKGLNNLDENIDYELVRRLRILFSNYIPKKEN